MKSKKHLYGAAYANSRARNENKIIGIVERDLAVARQQHAKSWELCAAISLARVCGVTRARCSKLANCFAPVYGWFTEGFRDARSEGGECAAGRVGGVRPACKVQWSVPFAASSARCKEGNREHHFFHPVSKNHHQVAITEAPASLSCRMRRSAELRAAAPQRRAICNRPPERRWCHSPLKRCSI